MSNGIARQLLAGNGDSIIGVAAGHGPGGRVDSLLNPRKGRIVQGIEAREIAPAAVVRREVVPTQTTLDGKAGSHFPTVLSKEPLLGGDPGRVIAEPELAVNAEVTEEGIRQRRARGGGYIGPIEGESAVQVVANAAPGAGSDPDLVAVIFAVPLDPNAGLEHVIAANLGQNVLKHENLPHTAGGVRQAADRVEAGDVHRGNLPRDVLARIAEDVGEVDPQSIPFQPCPSAQIHVNDVLGRGEGEIVEQRRAEVGSEIYGGAALRKHGRDLQQLAASRSPP